MLRQRFKGLFADAPVSLSVGPGLTAPPPDAPLARQQFEVMRTMDPKTQLVPLDRLDEARTQVQQRSNDMSFASTLPTSVNWVEHGPDNIGGRTRMVMFDPNDVTKKKVWAGGVAGGLWVNADITSQNEPWRKVDDFWENIAITSMAYAPTQPNIMYVGTGEAYYNSDSVLGGGIWKTTDGGQTWSRLSSTIPNQSASLETAAGAFRAIYRLVVTSSGVIYAATQGGLLKSTNGGLSWSFELVPSRGIGTSTGYSYAVGDIDLATDGTLYAVSQGSFVYKLPAGSTTWEVKLALSTGGRTEIALAPSTSGNTQVVYVVASSATSILRSQDGGANWSYQPLPSTSSSPLNDQSWYNLVVTVHPTNPNQVYLGTTRLYRSLNGSASWDYQGDYGNDIHSDQHLLIFRPGFPNEMLVGNDGGVYYSADFGDALAARPYFAPRNMGYNVTQFYSVAMKNQPNNYYMLGGTQDNGSINTYGNPTSPSSGNAIQGGDGMLCFIDQDDPNIQIASYQYNSFNLFDINGRYKTSLVYGSGTFVNPADYDSRTNALYTYNQVTNNNTTQLTRSSDVGRTNVLSYLNIPQYLGVSVIKVGVQANTLFLGDYAGGIYKVTNIDQPTPTVTLIDLPLYNTNIGSVACIELGATDNEILFTTSNYGVKSVWLTRDGGQNWTSKDEAGYGLPDIPIRYALFNPKDRRQVMLATELGVWFTNNIYAPNPGWTIANTGLANTRCDMLRYRTADGLVAVGTHGRGFFTTDFFTQPIPDELVLSPVNGPVCAGAALSVTFTATGIYQPSNVFTAYLTDASGSLSSAQVLGTVQSFSANNVPVPSTVPMGVYRLLIRSSSPVISSAASETFVVGVAPTFISALPSLTDRTTDQIYLQLGSQQNATAYYTMTPRRYAINAQQVRSGLLSDGQPALRSRTFSLQAGQPVSTTIGGLMPGTGYRISVVLEETISGCLSRVMPLDTIMAGTAPAYCQPLYNTSCSSGDVIADFGLEGTTLNRVNTGCSSGNYGEFLASAHRVRATADYRFIFRSYTNNGASAFSQHIAIWLDSNRDGVYAADELLYKTAGAAAYQWTGTVTMPPIVRSGLYRMRIRCRFINPVDSPCDSFSYGEAEDYLLDVDGLETMSDLSLTMRTTARITAVNQPVEYQVVVRNTGLQPASAIVVGSRLPLNSQLTSSTNWTMVNGQLRQVIPALAVGEETMLTFASMPTQAGTYQTAAQVMQTALADPDSRPGSGTGDGEDDMAVVDIRTTAASSDYFAAPNPDQFPLAAVRSSQPAPNQAGADLSLNLAVSSRTVNAGSMLTLLPTIYNAGGRSVSNVAVQFWLPAPLVAPGGTAVYTLPIASIPANTSVTQAISLSVGTGNAGYMVIRGAITAASELDPDSDRVTFGKGQDHEAFIDLRVFAAAAGGRRKVDETAAPPLVVFVSPASSGGEMTAQTYQADIRFGEDDEQESDAPQLITIQLQHAKGRIVKTWRMTQQERIQFLFDTAAYGPGSYRLVVRHEERTYRSQPFQVRSSARPSAVKR